jgi:GNAT superfamily N-acetyltransferase
MPAHKSSAVTIRKANPKDGDLLCDLIGALADTERLPAPDAAARERLKRDAFGSPPRFEAWIAEMEGKPVGYAITFYTYSTFLALPSLYLEDIYVLPEYRSQHVGAVLFQHCVKVALEQGCGRMEWQVLHWLTPAVEFYRKLGAQRLEGWQPYRLTRGDLEMIMAPADQPLALTRR